MEGDNQVTETAQHQKLSLELVLMRDWFKEWPDLKDTKVEEAERKIREEMPEAEIRVIPFPRGQNFRHDCVLESNRVWFFVDDAGFVRHTPYTR